jgi:DNA-directed RNA polymerase specialized sigma24 family protein
MDDIEMIDRWMDSPERLSALSEKQLAALLLYWIGYSQEEIGTIVGVSQQAVCRRLQRAKRELEEYEVRLHGGDSESL